MEINELIIYQVDKKTETVLIITPTEMKLNYIHSL